MIRRRLYASTCKLTSVCTRVASSSRSGYQEGNGYGFEVLRAKVLFTDALQRKARRVEQVKVKRRPRFDEVEPGGVHFYMMRTTPAEPEYDTKQVVREVTLGADLSTLLAEIDHWPTKP